MDETNTVQLKQKLRGWQILFISISAVIGGGVFGNNGEALEIAGPGGMLLAVFIIGLTQVGVMEAVSELMQKYPAPNAIFEYIRAFLDRELAWVCGVAYWYTYSSIFAAQNLTAANLTNYWGLSQTWQTIAFYVLAPLIMVAINALDVNVFGYMESVGGILKFGLVLGGSIALYIFGNEISKSGQTSPISDGFEANYAYASGHKTAVCYVIPLIAYSFLGVESITVPAFEAKRVKDLRWPSQCIAYIVLTIYMMISIGETVSLRWTDDHLPSIYGGVTKGVSPPKDFPGPHTSNMLVLAACRAGRKTFAGFLNGCVIFSVLSAANTSLYIASRTLYGLSRKARDTWLGKRLSFLSIVTSDSSPALFQGVPLPAVLFSAVAFVWLPFLQLKAGYAVLALIEIIAVSASVSCLVVWAALCGSFVRYYYWLKKNKDDLSNNREYVRLTKEYGTFTFFAVIQPFPAIVGLCGCFTVFAFTSATWWNSSASFSKIAVAYASPIILSLFWIILKLFKSISWLRRRLDHKDMTGLSPFGWVNLEKDADQVIEVCRDLEYKKPADVEVRRESPDAEESERGRSSGTEWIALQKPSGAYMQVRAESPGSQ